MPLTALFLLTLAAQAGGAELRGADRARSETAGLALAVEAGRYGGGYGLDALFYLPVAALLPGAAALPVTVWVQAGAGVSGQVPRALAAGASLGASLGRRHRATAALGWGAIDRSVLSLHGTVVADRSLHGPDAALGYEYLSDRGLLCRALAGAAYLPRSWQETLARFRPTLSVAFGWKLW